MEWIFDTHAHYDDKAFDKDRGELLSGLFEGGVGWIVDIGADFPGIPKVLKLSKQYERIYAAVGVHPSDVYDLKDSDIEQIRRYAGEEKVVAIGEIGLDYHYPDTDKEKQKRWFSMQMKLAKELSLPIVVHSRDAAADTLQMIKDEMPFEKSGVIHCFSYEPEMAKCYTDMGFYIGIGGVVTFKNARKLKEVAKEMPMERMLLETDCPYLAPEPFRGKRNQSGLIRYVAQTVASLRGMETDEVLSLTAENARRFYGIKG